MGTDYYVHVGPYIICKPKLIPQEVVRMFCVQPSRLESHGAQNNGSFCSVCGEPLTEKTVTTGNQYQDPSLGEVVDACDEKIMYMRRDGESIKQQLFYSNLSRSPGRNIDPRQADILENIDGEKIRNELKEFEEDHAHELCVLQKLYGAENVSVHWGIITNFN